MREAAEVFEHIAPLVQSSIHNHYVDFQPLLFLIVILIRTLLSETCERTDASRHPFGEASTNHLYSVDSAPRARAVSRCEVCLTGWLGERCIASPHQP